MKADFCLKCKYAHSYALDNGKYILECLKTKGKTFAYIECRYVRQCPLNIKKEVQNVKK